MLLRLYIVKYGNEVKVGEGIKKALDEGICKREDLFIIGKIWLEEKEHPEEAIRGTLNRLQLDYLDLYLDIIGLVELNMMSF